MVTRSSCSLTWNWLLFVRNTRNTPPGSFTMSETWETEEYRPPEIVALLGGIKRHNKKQVHPAGESTSSDVQDYDPEDGGDNGDGLARENKMGGLTLSQKIAFGLPNLALAAMYLPTSIHINKFFADTLLVKPGTLALGMLSCDYSVFGVWLWRWRCIVFFFFLRFNFFLFLFFFNFFLLHLLLFFIFFCCFHCKQECSLFCAITGHPSYFSIFLLVHARDYVFTHLGCVG